MQTGIAFPELLNTDGQAGRYLNTAKTLIVAIFQSERAKNM
jgi:hypothetical protein